MASVLVASNAHTVVTTGWTNPSNAFATTADGVFATASPARNATVVGDFGFPDITTAQIPDGATITRVVVSVNWGMTAAVTGGTLGVQIFNNGTALGTETTQTVTTQQNGLAIVSTGITLADLRSASTLIKGRVRVSKGATNTAMTGNLDFVSLQVDYVIPKPPVTVTTTSARTTRTRQSARRAGAVAAIGLFAPWVQATVNKPLPFGMSASVTAETPTATVNQPIPLSIHATATGSGAASTAVPTKAASIVQRAPLPRRSGGVQAMGLVVQPAGALGTITATLATPIPIGVTSTATSIDGAIPGAGSLAIYRERPRKITHKPIVLKAQSAASSGSSATVAAQIVVGRSSTATVRVDATLAKLVPIGRTATAQVRVDATLAKPVPIGRTITAAISATATVAKPIPFSRTATAQVRVDATVVKAIPIQRTITAQALSSGSASLAKPIPISRSITAQVRVDATLAKAIAVGRTASAQVRVDGTLATPLPITGVSTATVLGNGQLLLAQPIPFGRSIAAHVRVDGTVAKPLPIRITSTAIFPSSPPPVSATTAVIITDDGIRTVLVSADGLRTVLVSDDGVRTVIVDGT